MKTLIITVGTRQIGWRCSDGVVRCFGADGDRSAPKHIDELYAELGLERQAHKDGSSWSVRHLGERYYQLCQTPEDFAAVELLLDGQVISEQVENGLGKIILWGTDQPEMIPWKFRRLDTLWLVELMAGKLKLLYPQVEVAVWNPSLPLTNYVDVLPEIEKYLLKEVLSSDLGGSELWIQSKGSVAVVASSLEICAAALVRQIDVILVSPHEPDPVFQAIDETAAKSAQPSEKYTRTQMSNLFWPLERDRIITAWQQGNFQEAAVWLEGHRGRYKALYDLSQFLTLTANWQLSIALNSIQSYWIDSKKARELCDPEMLAFWKKSLQKLSIKTSTKQSRPLLIWESWFVIELEISRKNYTAAFLQFAQMIERLLLLRYNDEDWLKKGFLEQGENEFRKPGLGGLVIGWQRSISGYQHTLETWVKILDQIREMRNGVAHRAEPVTFQELEALWTKQGIQLPKQGNPILVLMRETIHQIKAPEWQFPNKPLLQQLYEWGLERLQAVP